MRGLFASLASKALLTKNVSQRQSMRLRNLLPFALDTDGTHDNDVLVLVGIINR